MNAFTRGVVALLALAGAAVARGEVLSGEPIASDASAAVDGWLACRDAKARSAECAALRSAAIETLAADLRLLGSGGSFGPLSLLLAVLRKSPEPELRAAAADGVGMIGARPTETPALAAAFDDPSPAVRKAAWQALGSSTDPTAQALAGRAQHADEWKSFEPERQADLSKLKLPVYAGASPLRFATDVPRGTAHLASADGTEKVVAFYAAKAKRPALSREEFAAAYSGEPAPEAVSEEDAEEAKALGVDPADMARAMAMMDAMNEQLDSGKSAEEAQRAMIDQASASSASADVYADDAVYGSPSFVVFEESNLTGRKQPMRYVVVFRDMTLGKTGIALHAPAALP